MNNDKLINEVNKISGITEQLDTIKKFYISNYCQGGGLDDTQNLQNLIDIVNEDKSNNIKILFDIEQLYLTKTFHFTRGNIDIDFLNCDIKFEAINDLPSETLNRYLGIFNFVGDYIGDTKNILSYEKIYNYNAYNSNKALKLSLSNTNNINVGDFIQLSMNNKDTTQNVNIENPKIDLVVKIVGIDTNTASIILDIDFPYDFNDLNGVVRRINPLKNITVKNLKYEELTNISSDSTSVVPNQSILLKTVNGLFFKYCVNVKCNSVEIEKSTNVGVFTFMCYDVDVKNINIVNPRFVCPGRGYGVQFNNSFKCYAENIQGINARHLVDLTASHKGYIKNVYGNMLKHRAFMTHGTYENDITFENCQGTFSLEAGIDFGGGSYNVSFINCDLINGSFGLSKYITINKSKLVIDPSLGGKPYNVSLTNSKVFIKNNADIVSNTRSTGGSYNFTNCDVSIIKASLGFLNIKGLDYFDLRNCRLFAKNTDLTSDDSVTIKLSSNNVNVIGNSIIKNVGFEIDPTVNLNLNIDCDLIFNDTTLTTFINCENYCDDSKKIFVNLCVNTKYVGGTTKRLTRFMGSPTTNQNMFLRITNSNIICIGGSFNIIPFRNSNNSGSSVKNTQIQNNVFVNVGCENFTKEEYSNNIWI